jgi:hypothetical protein
MRQQTGQDLQQGRFTRAVGPHYAGPAAGGQYQVNTMQYSSFCHTRTQANAYFICVNSYCFHGNLHVTLPNWVPRCISHSR